MIDNEIKVFYSMVALLECARDIQEYLLASPHRLVHTNIKNELKGIFRRYQIFTDTLLRPLPPADQQLWKAEWKRDYGTYSAIFELMSEMTDQQRHTLEQFATQLIKENTKT